MDNELDLVEGENAGAGEVFASEEIRKAAVEYVKTGMDECASAKEKRTARVNKWRRNAEVTPETATKDFPWDKASNLVSPLTLTDVNGMTAALKAAYDQKNPFFHVRALNPTYNKHAEALEKFMSVEVESKFHTNLREIKNELFYEMVLLGTKTVIVAWDKDINTFKKKGMDGSTQEVTSVRHNGPKIIPVRDESFYCPSYVTDLQTSPWVAFEHDLSWYDLKQREAQGTYSNVEMIKDTAVSSMGENQDADRSRAGVEPGSTPDIYKIVEAYLFWDAEGDGRMVDVKVWFERTTGTVIREEFNGLGVRNMATGYYYRLPGQFYGMGVGWICENPQDGIDALTNMAINSTHISSLQGFVTRRGSGIGTKVKFKPLFQLECDVPREDFAPITFPNTIQPNMALASQLRNDADRGVGANNALLGFPDTVAKSGGTASGYMFQAQQSSRSFNSVVENTDSWLSEIAMLLVFQIIDNKDEVNTDVIGEEDGKLVREVLDMKVQDIHLNFGFSVTATEVDETEEAKRQSLLTLSQLYSMYGQKTLGLIQSEIQLLLPFAQMMPQIQQKLQESIMQYLEYSNQFKVGSTTLMKYILDFFSIEQKGYLPYVKNIQMMLEWMYSMRDMQLGGVQDAIRQGTGSPRTERGGEAGVGGPMGGAIAENGGGQDVNQPANNGPGAGVAGGQPGGGGQGGV